MRKMEFSRPSLHPPVISTDEHKAIAETALHLASRSTQLTFQVAAAPLSSLFFPLSTVSLAQSFDAYIEVQLAGAPTGSATQLLVDSGNSVLIMPRWEDIAALPNYAANYAVLGEGTEPWGCPAKIVRGPINLTTITNDLFRIDGCVFYACTGDSPSNGSRTANFGTGCLSPWTASEWNTPQGLNVVMQAPLSYAAAYPYAEFNYAPAGAVHAATTFPNVASGSYLGLHMTMPVGYHTFEIIKNLIWMSLIPKSLAISNQSTQWPGALNSPPIAMIDTGGTCVFLSDPNGCLYSKAWPDPVANPPWASTSTSCESIRDAVTIAVGDTTGTYTYTIDTSDMPASVQGLTLVMCEQNAFMMGQNGMNVGGISALINSILIDYANARVGFKPKTASAGVPGSAPGGLSAPSQSSLTGQSASTASATLSMEQSLIPPRQKSTTPQSGRSARDGVGHTIRDVRHFFIFFLIGNAVWLLAISSSVFFQVKGGGRQIF
jgi:hypothetical protein